MTDNHPDAETVLAVWHRREGGVWCGECKGLTWPDGDDAAELANDALAALSAAGLAVVRVGDVPPWMEFAGAYDDPDQVRVRYEDEACDHDFEECSVCRPLYVLKDQP
jgi:hypothetical protein